jgi:hypothetical protein
VSSGETDRYCGLPPIGSSATARSFGADVSLGLEGQSLFFVLGHGGPPDAAVRAAGGQVVTRLPDPRRVLAVAPLDAYQGLSRHPAVALAGAVSIDPERFGSFAKLVGLDASPHEPEP